MSLLIVLLLSVPIWVGLRGQTGLTTLLVPLLLGTVLLIRHGWTVLRAWPLRTLARRTLALLQLLMLFVYELVLANLQQLRVVLAPRIEISPCWVRYPSELHSPELRSVLALLISLTPGSTTAHVDAEGTLWLHVLDERDPSAVVSRLQRLLEEPLRRLES